MKKHKIEISSLCTSISLIPFTIGFVIGFIFQFKK